MITNTCWLTTLISIGSVLAGPLTLRADEKAPVPLPAPRLERGISLMKALGEKMRLRPDQRIILAQSVGYPKPPAAP